jgi:predicted hydrocarbon binding protein
LYQLGINYGIEVGSQVREVSKDVPSAIKFFEYYGLLAGWGRLEMSEFEPIEGKLRVKIHENFFARSLKSDNGQPSCYFLSGMLAGLLEGLTEGSYHCLEIKCLYSGSKFCEFVLKRNSSE